MFLVIDRPFAKFVVKFVKKIIFVKVFIIPLFNIFRGSRIEYFANSFFPYTIKEWNNLSPEIRKSVSYEVFKNSLLKFIRPSPNSLFNVSDSLGIKLLTRLRLGLSHLREHKFNHNFQDTINPLCPCSLESESTTHFFLRCQNFTDLRKCLMNELIKTDSCILTLDEMSLTKLLLIWR